MHITVQIGECCLLIVNVRSVQLHSRNEDIQLHNMEMGFREKTDNSTEKLVPRTGYRNYTKHLSPKEIDPLMGDSEGVIS